jgi:hypothetical protein
MTHPDRDRGDSSPVTKDELKSLNNSETEVDELLTAMKQHAIELRAATATANAAVVAAQSARDAIYETIDGLVEPDADGELPPARLQ